MSFKTIPYQKGKNRPSRKKMSWLKSLNPGDSVILRLPNMQRPGCLDTLQKIDLDSDCESGVKVWAELSEGGLDSLWIEPLELQEGDRHDQ